MIVLNSYGKFFPLFVTTVTNCFSFSNLPGSVPTFTPYLSLNVTKTVEVSFIIYSVLSIDHSDLPTSTFPGRLVYIKRYLLPLAVHVIVHICLVTA